MLATCSAATPITVSTRTLSLINFPISMGHCRAGKRAYSGGHSYVYCRSVESLIMLVNLIYHNGTPVATEQSEKKPNDPAEVDHDPVRSAIVRGVGTTPSEKYLARLAERSFLNLWSYPNTFIDKRVRGKGDGKELCDLLVVCGDHILIFSDKTVAWPDDVDLKLAWKRWYKRAILKSVDQIRGAERWITQFPNRIFLDRACSEPLPINLPPPERRRIHGIVVALGAGEACKKYFNGGIGSLFIQPNIKGVAHYNGDEIKPLAIGDVDPNGPFVHIIDDGTLDIVLGELDTVTDLTDYLSKKEKFIRPGTLLSAAGEEELVAYYMTHMNSSSEHDFTRPDGTDFGSDAKISFDVGFYDDLKGNAQYRAKKSADEISYAWDRLIELFTTNMLAGTTIVPKGVPFSLSDLEQGIRHMALVPRYKRRLFGEAIIGAFEKSHTADRFTRAILPGPTEKDRDTGFFFMTLAIPRFEVEGGYAGYREVRRKLLEIYAFSLLEKYRDLKRIVGIATEPRNREGKGGSSEDLLVVEAGEWTSEFLEQLEEAKKNLNIAQEGNFKTYSTQGNEFPEVAIRPVHAAIAPRLNRKQRRAAAAKARKRN